MRPEKKQLVSDIQSLLDPSAGLFLVSYQGLTVEDFSAFRTTLAGCQAECHVVPNRVFRLAAKEAGLESLAEVGLSGDTALIVGSDIVGAAKAVSDFAKDQEVVDIKLGCIGGKVIGEGEIKQLASMPPREVLLGQLLGTLQAPAQQLVGVMNAKLCSVLYALQAYIQKQENAA